MKILSKRTLLTIVLVGFVFSAALVFYFIPKNPAPNGSTLLINENAVAFPKQEQASFGLPASPIGRPMRLIIPKINVNSAVEYVGLAPGGAMDAPKSPDDVAWFNLGPHPGENGSAVIAGHYGWKNGKPSAFDNLYKLRQGDKLFVEDDKGVIISFVVRESRRYDPNADASAVFGSNDEKSHLNLITCEGVWDKTSKSYPIRLVIFADKE
jgi:LPXTG-site transpeptidase (sortase) family protein